ncbi:small ribosomal subunit protein eS21-like [Aedes albopictus]|uniref:40S ribosomal protein S21 n=1 Tax=Aedes albopictus TaxID=7160 RepID=A0ABM1YXM4_AEDAL|nr:40S ribosomal protein S21-like [Aedes albopictus]XP_019544504.1 40S ribosomal protein S21-like [Aedes albopictus]
MENDAGEFVDLYCPRKCSSCNRIIHAKDHASIQINIVDVNPETGRMLETSKVYAICGEIRRMGESDDCIVRLAKKDGLLTKNY